MKKSVHARNCECTEARKRKATNAKRGLYGLHGSDPRNPYNPRFAFYFLLFVLLRELVQIVRRAGVVENLRALEHPTRRSIFVHEIHNTVMSKARN